MANPSPRRNRSRPSQRIQGLSLEMETSSSELIDFFLEREGAAG